MGLVWVFICGEKIIRGGIGNGYLHDGLKNLRTIRTIEVSGEEISPGNREISCPDFGLNLRRKF